MKTRSELINELWKEFLEKSGAGKPSSLPFKIFIVVLLGLFAFGVVRHFFK